MSPHGDVLDPGAIPISTAQSGSWLAKRTPTVAFDGTNYLVAWEAFGGTFIRDIYGSRVSPGGISPRSRGIPISVATDIPGRAVGGL